MGFTTAAFIRRNTPELRKKLEELGYKKYGNPFQITDDSKLITTIDGEYVPYNVPLDDSFIDCGTNEELFLAIAASTKAKCGTALTASAFSSQIIGITPSFQQASASENCVIFLALIPSTSVSPSYIASEKATLLRIAVGFAISRTST